MTICSSDLDRRQVPTFFLLPFLAMAFGLAWGILALFIFLPDQMTAVFGQLTGDHPLFILAVWAPAIAAVIIITVLSGLGGLRKFLSRLLIWRCAPVWYVFLLVGVPLIFYGSFAFKDDLSHASFPFTSFSSLIAALGMTLIKGPVEELGWRGLALPLLQRKLAPIWSGLILGVIWGFWHLPAFMLSGTPQSAWSFTPFFAGAIAISVIATALFNASRGSLLLTACLHFQLNNPIWPDAQPFDTFGFVAVAVLIVWLDRKAMFNKDAAVKNVVPLN